MTAPPASPMPPPDFAAFLRTQLPLQAHNVASYRLADDQVWLKKAGPRHGMAGYRVLGLIASLSRLDVLRPVPNLGGTVAIATEAQRLRTLAARGLRVPEVLALQPEGLLLRHLGLPGEATPSFDAELQAALAEGPQTVLALWQQGLAALHAVHASDACLSQAFARNLVRCPDGVLGFIDFEDDPSASLPLALCQVRDLLCYVHSTALYLRQAGALPAARQHWAGWLAQQAPALRTLLSTTAARLSWLRHLPQSRRLGRDLQRARAAFDLLEATLDAA